MNRDLSDTTAGTERDQELLNKLYRIDPTAYEKQGRSFLFALQQRMSAESLKKLGEEDEKQVPVEDAKSGRVRFRRQKADVSNDPIALIEEFCSKTPAYNDSRLPLKEILFRILLAGGNQPKSLAQVYQEVRAWVSISDTRVITPEALSRIMEHDDYYGFSRVADA